MNEIKATNYLTVYEDLGIDTGRLGCIMVDTDPLIISDVVKESDYYYSEDQKWVQGNVSEEVPHVTILYGLMRSGLEMRKHVTAVLEGWELPSITIKEVSFFYGHGGDYITIIALVDVTDALKEGHQRLSLLPHVNTFGEYKPHITLAYVKASADWQTYVAELNQKFRGEAVAVRGVNLGE